MTLRLALAASALCLVGTSPVVGQDAGADAKVEAMIARAKAAYALPAARKRCEPASSGEMRAP